MIWLNCCSCTSLTYDLCLWRFFFNFFPFNAPPLLQRKTQTRKTQTRKTQRTKKALKRRTLWRRSLLLLRGMYNKRKVHIQLSLLTGLHLGGSGRGEIAAPWKLCAPPRFQAFKIDYCLLYACHPIDVLPPPWGVGLC